MSAAKIRRAAGAAIEQGSKPFGLGRKTEAAVIVRPATVHVQFMICGRPILETDAWRQAHFRTILAAGASAAFRGSTGSPQARHERREIELLLRTPLGIAVAEIEGTR